MNHYRVYNSVRLGWYVFAALFLVISQVALAQQPRSGRARGGDKGAHEGIKVHGHWTIEVRNPDGTLVTHREFENSLINCCASPGALTLATALGRASTVGLWWVLLEQVNSPGGPCLLNNAPGGCVLAESADSIAGSQFFHNLTLGAPFSSSDPNYLKLTLSGTFTVQNTAQIDRVATRAGACAPTVAPGNCTNSPSSGYNNLGVTDFTSTTISPSIPVSIGQSVQVTVVFSFS